MYLLILSNKFSLLSTFDYCRILILEIHFELFVNSNQKGLNNLLVLVRVITENILQLSYSKSKYKIMETFLVKTHF